MRKQSVGRQFALVVGITVAVVGVAGFLAGRSILGQVAALAEDKPVLDALDAGRQALVDLHKERRMLGETVVNGCILRGALSSCSVRGLGMHIEPMAAPSEGKTPPYWENEQVYVAADTHASLYQIRFDWDELKPRFSAISDIIGTRDHVAALLPTLTDSFLVVFAAALVGAGLLGLLVTYLLSRQLSARVTELIRYTGRIAGGELGPAPVSTRGGDEVGLLAEAMHRMAKDLDEARQRLVLSEKMQSWQNVARKVAHEIKNPLTPISLVASELAKRASRQTDPETSALLTEASRVLAEETESLGRMVKEFSAFARLPEPELLQGDLLELVRDFVQRNTSDTGPLFAVEAPAERFPVVMDRGMLTQVLHNLVNNARLAKGAERVSIRFGVSAAAEGQLYYLDIFDNGPGVPATLRDTLFDAYVTSRSTGDGEKGMGLGLTIARKIAVDHGGRLLLAATGLMGTQFRLELPRPPDWEG